MVGPPPPLPGLPPGTIRSIHNEVDSYTMMLDSWLFPFFNIYGILGRADGEVEIDLNRIVPLGILTPQTFKVGYEGLVYGGGFVVAAGWDRYFTSTDVSYTVTDLTGFGSIDTWVVSPKIGFGKVN